MTPNELQRTYDGRKYKSPANDTEIMSVVPLLIDLWEAAINLSEFSHSPFYKGNISELTKVLKKLGDAE